jgi:glycosyltransferase involved in cell wall biosynthesis
MDKAFDEAGLVIIPTGRRQTKSANRAVEAIRRGLFVVAEPLPAYSDLGIWIGDIAQGIEWALSHKEEAMERVRISQEYVEKTFSPRRIAEQWLALLESL